MQKEQQMPSAATQAARVVGEVEFRAGDGPKMPIPHGPVEIVTTPTEATLTWTDGDTRGAATLSLNEFRRYVAEGALRLDR